MTCWVLHCSVVPVVGPAAQMLRKKKPQMWLRIGEVVGVEMGSHAERVELGLTASAKGSVAMG